MECVSSRRYIYNGAILEHVYAGDHSELLLTEVEAGGEILRSCETDRLLGLVGSSEQFSSNAADRL